MIRLRLTYLILFSLLSQFWAGCNTQTKPTDTAADSAEYQLVWSDEFESEGAIDNQKWHQQTQLPRGDSWFNEEVQHYTDRLANAFVKDGKLHLIAKKESYTNQGVTKAYTSARLNSKHAFTYGKVEVKAKLAMGEGVWPAIWTLGQNVREKGGYWADEYGKKGWPECGEIDIMEHWGDEPQIIQSAVHTPSSHGRTTNKQAITGTDVGNVFHIYGMEWTAEKIDFFYDDSLYYTYQPKIINEETFPFQSPQYLLLNIAMGGFNRTIDPNFTQSAMIIDYVRIYQK